VVSLPEFGWILGIRASSAGVARASIPAEILAYAAYPKRCSSNANGLGGQTSAGFWKSVRPFKGIFCVDVSEFESYMPSHAVRSLLANVPARLERQAGMLDVPSTPITEAFGTTSRKISSRFGASAVVS
jgi:hypothetical protein